jgi:hypothetical protein
MEQDILDQMSEIIDDARETDDQAVRTALYEKAMGYVLDLAVELPVYQRQQLYAYNGNVIDPTSFPEDINPYSSPLDRIWEIKFNEGASAGGVKGGSESFFIVSSTCLVLAIGVAVFFLIPEEKRKTLFVKKKPYVIPEGEIDEIDMNAYNQLYKKDRR